MSFAFFGIIAAAVVAILGTVFGLGRKGGADANERKHQEERNANLDLIKRAGTAKPDVSVQDDPNNLDR